MLPISRCQRPVGHFPAFLPVDICSHSSGQDLHATHSVTPLFPCPQNRCQNALLLSGAAPTSSAPSCWLSRQHRDLVRRQESCSNPAGFPPSHGPSSFQPPARGTFHPGLAPISPKCRESHLASLCCAPAARGKGAVPDGARAGPTHRGARKPRVCKGRVLWPSLAWIRWLGRDRAGDAPPEAGATRTA